MYLSRKYATLTKSLPLLKNFNQYAPKSKFLLSNVEAILTY